MSLQGNQTIKKWRTKQNAEENLVNDERIKIPLNDENCIEMMQENEVIFKRANRNSRASKKNW